jgi:hypothetical protein
MTRGQRHWDPRNHVHVVASWHHMFLQAPSAPSQPALGWGTGGMARALLAPHPPTQPPPSFPPSTRHWPHALGAAAKRLDPLLCPCLLNSAFPKQHEHTDMALPHARDVWSTQVGVVSAIIGQGLQEFTPSWLIACVVGLGGAKRLVFARV